MAIIAETAPEKVLRHPAGKE